MLNRREEAKVPLKLTTESEIVAVATAAGLEKAVAGFRNDVIGAAAAAAHARNAFSEPNDPTTEPWPPMRTGSGV